MCYACWASIFREGPWQHICYIERRGLHAWRCMGLHLPLHEGAWG